MKKAYVTVWRRGSDDFLYKAFDEQTRAPIGPNIIIGEGCAADAFQGAVTLLWLDRDLAKLGYMMGEVSLARELGLTIEEEEREERGREGKMKEDLALDQVSKVRFWCAYCRSDFPDWFTICPNCNHPTRNIFVRRVSEGPPPESCVTCRVVPLSGTEHENYALCIHCGHVFYRYTGPDQGDGDITGEGEVRGGSNG